jgi:hypothetical protein
MLIIKLTRKQVRKLLGRAQGIGFLLMCLAICGAELELWRQGVAFVGAVACLAFVAFCEWLLG